MARPDRKTVDYFPHYISSGKKMFYIEQKYGNDGYAVWFKLLESLASTDDHFINLNNNMDLMFMSAKCRVSTEVLTSILDDLCELQEIDKFLWLNKIVYSHKFIESIKDAYDRRKTKCMNYESFCTQYSSLCTTITKLMYEKECNNTQSKVNNNKEKKSKGKDEEESNDKPQTDLSQFTEIDKQKTQLLEKWVKYKSQTDKPIKNQMQKEQIFKSIQGLKYEDAETIINYSIQVGAMNPIWNHLDEKKKSNNGKNEEVKNKDYFKVEKHGEFWYTQKFENTLPKQMPRGWNP